jgi:hypothetical protein
MPPTSSSLGDEKHVPSLPLSTAARDPVLIASLAKLARRGSRCDAAYFVVARGRKACPLTPPQHGGAIRCLIAPLAKARCAPIALGGEAINSEWLTGYPQVSRVRSGT